MIGRVSVGRFRGIRQGSLDELRRVTVLIGRNGSGKSSVLEALYLASACASSRDEVRGVDKLDYLVSRRGGRGSWGSSRALLWFMSETEEPIEIALSTAIGEIKVVAVDVAVDAVSRTRPVRLITRDGLAVDLEWGVASRDVASIRQRSYAQVDIAGELAEVRDFLRGILLVDAALLRNPATVELYAWPRLLPKRLDREVVKFVREELEPEAEGLTYVPTAAGTYLALQTSKTTVRVDDLGDGVRNALLTAMLVVAYRPTVLLLEEPELHMHPGGLASLTGFLLRAAKEMGFQIIATTHSVEFVELARALASELGLELAALFLERVDGVLRSRSFSADDVDALRKLGIDMRLLYRF